MNWTPPQGPPGGQPPGGQPPGGQPPYGQGPRPGGPQPGQPMPGGQPGHMPPQQQAAPKAQNFYQLLQVARDANPTIIRYAYRFLAAMYHPDNTESGDAEKFRIITEAWRTLSDEGKRAAYDMTLGAAEAQAAPMPGQQQAQAPRAGMAQYKVPKAGISWSEIELRLAILNLLLEQRRKKPKSGGSSAKMMMDCLDIHDMAEIEYAIWYLREKGLIEAGERAFMITVQGVDYIIDTLSKPTSMNAGATEEKIVKNTKPGPDGGVPAVIS